MATLTVGLSEDQRARFSNRGLVRLERVIPPHAAEVMADRLWQDLARRYGAQRDAPKTWRTERPFGFKALQAAGVFDAMATPQVRALLDDLLGPGGWTPPPHWGQPLVCFPSTGPCEVPHRNWHLDGPCEPAGRRVMVGRLFLILAPLEPHGGGTLVAAGSHRVVEAIADRAGARLSSGEMRERLASAHPWFAELISMPDEGEQDRPGRFMAAETEALGVPLRVEEMTGDAGDLYLMHPRALHAPAPNGTSQPRLVLSQYIVPKL